MRSRLAEDLHDPRQRSLRASSHVERLDRHPHRVDADHRISSRSQAPHCAGAANGQLTRTVIGPRLISTSIEVDAASSAVAIATGTNDSSAALSDRSSRSASSSLPGRAQSATTCALNSSLCRRRRCRPSRSSPSVVCTCPPKVTWTRCSLPSSRHSR